MVVNFRAREISRGVRKLARTPTLKKKKEMPIVMQLRTGILELRLNSLFMHFLFLFSLYGMDYINIYFPNCFIFYHLGFALII